MEAEAIISEWIEMHPEDGVAVIDDQSDDASETSDAFSEHSSVAGNDANESGLDLE
jgi:hypothetical protein